MIDRALPRCARCDKPVEDLEETADHFMDRVVYVAVCHGARDRVVVPMAAFREAQIGSLAFGDAFVTTPALPAAKENAR